MKKFKLNVQRHICILLCFILYITVLPLPVSAEEAKSKTVRVGWYEGTYNTTGADGQRRGYSYEYQQAVAAHTGWKYESRYAFSCASHSAPSSYAAWHATSPIRPTWL